MCGITGWVGPVALDQERLARMCAAIAHRGPDEAGAFVLPGKVGLGFQRLSIIDLDTGSQPIKSEDRSVVACCNGEIYNFQSLREELTSRGHRFATRSDSEVVVHLYEEMGADFVQRLEGMFAIALWDGARQRLVLARDRLGVKPLYWSTVPNGVVYGSEPAAILASGLFEPRPDPAAIMDYLTLQYVPAPRSGFEGISKLAPGEMLTFEAGVASVVRYWQLDHNRPTTHKSAPERLDELDDLLGRVTRERLVADVPLGAFLSGGIDSSLVVSYMTEASSRVSTFSIDFPHAGFSEGKYARQVASIYGTEHEQLMVEPDIIPTILETVRFAGEPFADSSAIPTYILSEMTRRSVTVALSGDGGDEAFAGYTRHKVATYADRLGPVPRIADPVARLLAGADRNSKLGRVRRGLQVLALPTHDRYAHMMAHFDPTEIESLATPEFLDAAGGAWRAWNEALALPALGGVDRFAALDTATYLPGDLLLKVDRMSMAHALEVRSPLLDRRIHEFAATLPRSDKLRRGRTKWILKELALRRGLPPELVHRRKQGFGIPIGEWFRDELRPWLTDLLTDPATLGRGYFCHGAIETLLTDHIERRSDNGYRLYNLAVLELWHRRFVDTSLSGHCDGSGSSPMVASG